MSEGVTAGAALPSLTTRPWPVACSLGTRKGLLALPWGTAAAASSLSALTARFSVVAPAGLAAALTPSVVVAATAQFHAGVRLQPNLVRPRVLMLSESGQHSPPRPGLSEGRTACSRLLTRLRS